MNLQAELIGNISHDISGDCGWIGQKRSQKPYGPQLDGKSQARVVSLAAMNEPAISIIEVEIARQLHW